MHFPFSHYLHTEEGKPLMVLGSGKPLRQFIYSKAGKRVWSYTEWQGRGCGPILKGREMGVVIYSKRVWG